MSQRVRVRFAPSPTGPLHMGGVRTALFNYLFARKHGGDFILRIEDTDQTRFVEGAEQYIIDSLNWCGLSPDEGQGVGGDKGPYKQSERKEAGIYRTYVDTLLENDQAYYAFDTPEELDKMREDMKKAGVAAPQYNGITRTRMSNSLTLPSDEVKRRLDAGDPYVVRIKIPRNEEVKFHDLIRGWVVVHSSNLDDKVIFKSDGMPTYHLANVVDDHLMEISHVIRGEEWLPSAPLHVLLYRAFGWEEKMPKMAHLPLILKPDGNGKLSKRDGDRLGFPVFPMEWNANGETASGYREKGYFHEAFVNMLAFLGWNPGTPQELFTLDELVESFSLERVGKAGAKFDPDKTQWFNQQYLRTKPAAELLERLRTYDIDLSGYEESKLLAMCELMKERATFVPDLMEGAYLLHEPESYDEKVVRKKWKEGSGELMTELKVVFEGLAEFNAESIENAFKQFLEDKSLGFGAAGPLLRLLLSGKGAGPSLFEIAEVLGKEETLKRMTEGIEKLNAHV